jgi:hypothetical protein
MIEGIVLWSKVLVFTLNNRGIVNSNSTPFVVDNHLTITASPVNLAHTSVATIAVTNTNNICNLLLQCIAAPISYVQSVKQYWVNIGTTDC